MPQTQKKTKSVTTHSIVLLFNDSDWGEIFAAIESKICYVKQHFYDDGSRDCRAQDNRWLKQLERIKKMLEKKLREHNIQY
jgi:hypothetical protein